MSTTEPATSGAELEVPPTYDLECLYDDCHNPSRLTVFSPGDESVATEWVTADLSTAVPLEEIR